MSPKELENVSHSVYIGNKKNLRGRGGGVENKMKT